jgi:RNA polymerase sigma-70 factor (ECF subfamily)
VTANLDSDNVLVERARAGDRRAFGLLAEKYQRRLFRVVLRFVHDHFEAEDIVQESFLKAYRALPGFRGDSEFYTWLYRIAINLARTYWQNYSKQHDAAHAAAEHIDEDNAQSFEARDGDTPELILMGKQMAIAVNAALETLPFELHLALVLREIDGLNYDEIANILMCPIGTVRSRLHRARETVARSLQEYA